MLNVNFCSEVYFFRFLLFAALSFTHILFPIAVFLNRCIFYQNVQCQSKFCLALQHDSKVFSSYNNKDEKILDLKTGFISRLTKQICH